MSNIRALPPPNVADRPGPGDWVNLYGSIFDGDYITLRNSAWGGTTIKHAWSSDTNTASGTHITAEKHKNVNDHGPKPLNLMPVRMDNAYSFCIRRVIFDSDKKAWVLPSWDAWQSRTPINITDHVIFLCPNDPNLVMGTKNPGTYGNNGDYKCRLEPFPIATVDDLVSHSATGHLQRIISMGFWRNDKNSVDFLNQSRFVWTFRSTFAGRMLCYGSAVNIRNVWTEVKARESTIWDAVGGAQVSIINHLIVSNFRGGRNLTQASGSDGSVVKLALTNHDKDDKACWVIDGWHGNRYPVQRALIPVEAPPNPVPAEPDAPVPPPIDIPDLTDQILRPPPAQPGLTFETITGTTTQTSLSHATLLQNPDSVLDTISKSLFGQKWNHISYLQQITLGGLIALGVIVITDEVVKTSINKIL